MDVQDSTPNPYQRQAKKRLIWVVLIRIIYFLKCSCEFILSENRVALVCMIRPEFLVSWRSAQSEESWFSAQNKICEEFSNYFLKIPLDTLFDN
jgi:hypothetical protein